MDYNEKLTKTQILGSSIGALGGIYYAFTQKSGFWGYAGYFILGSLVGSLTGNVVSIAFKKNGQADPVMTTEEMKADNEKVEASGIKRKGWNARKRRKKNVF